MRPAHAARVAGAVLVLAAAVLAWLGQPAAGIVLAAAGLAMALLVTPSEGPVESAGLDTAAALPAGLGLDGPGTYLPPRDANGAVRLFIAADARAGGRLPEAPSNRPLHRSTPTRLGLSLVPPGAELEEAWAKRNGLPQGGGDAALLQHARMALPALGAGEEVRVESGKQGLRVRYVRTGYAHACHRAHEEWAPWHLQGCCPACSFVGMLAARAHGRPVRLVANDVQGDTVSLEWEVVRSSRAH